MPRSRKVVPTIELIVHPEDIPVRGNAVASGDDAIDKRVEDEIIARIDDGDPWAWCCVEVRASHDEISSSDYLGGCSYRDEAYFRTGGYYEDMVKQAVDGLNLEREKMIRSLRGIRFVEPKE